MYPARLLYLNQKEGGKQKIQTSQKGDVEMKKIMNKKENNKFIDLVVADIRERKLYIASATAKRILKGIKPSNDLLDEYKEKYPEFQLQVNDNFFMNVLGILPQ